MAAIKRMDVTISTRKLTESKEFYMKYFGFELIYESDWYIELLAPGQPAAGVSFTLPQREAGEFFSSKGIILSLEVAAVDQEYARICATGLTLQQELQDKPWGERSFVVDDPNGVHIYVYSSIPATPEYQEIYASFKK